MLTKEERTKLNRENGKKGGRPKGSKLPKTIEREKVERQVKDRIAKHADSLISAQLSIAKGQQFLYKIEKEKIVGPKGGVSYRSMKPILVTSQGEIEQFLEDLVDKANGELEDERDPSATYYYITTKEPNNMALDSLQNRVFGRPKESLDLTTGGKPIGRILDELESEGKKKKSK